MRRGAPGSSHWYGPRSEADEREDSDYFNAYSWIGIHEDMIKDTVRTDAYRNAIRDNAVDFKGKAVLDVGCGTGILSMFAAQAGARVVYAVDASDIADSARLLVERNGFSDVIKVIKGRVEDVDLPEQVDVIVSEWMGYFLVYESMLNSVLVARDKFLKPGGHLYPSHASLYLMPFRWDEHYDEHIAFWDEVYGFDFSPLEELARKNAFFEPLVDCIAAENQMALRPHRVLHLDLRTATTDQLQEWSSDFSFSSTISSDAHGICAFFDVEFCGERPDRQRSVLTTSPRGRETHWAQTLFFFDDAIPMQQDDVLSGRITARPNKNFRRAIDVHFEWTMTPGPTHEADPPQSFTKDFRVN